MATVIKRKIKKGPIYIGIAIIIIITGTIFGIKYYNNYRYEQTNEFKLIEKGYTKEETKLLEEKLPQDKVNELCNQEKNDLLLQLLTEKYYLSKNLEKYLKYAKEEKETKTYDIVAIVNTGTDKKEYEEIKETEETKENVMLVNKYYKLDNNFTPKNLVEVSNWYSYGENKLEKVAYDAFLNMQSKAKEEDITLIINFSYRDYQTQEKLYNSKKTSLGTKAADKAIARPGHSDHTTALSFDLYTKNQDTFDESQTYEWMKNNAHLFGFIERYPKGKEYLTKFSYEPWHWRYVGIEIATQIHEEEITLEEYYAYYIES